MDHHDMHHSEETTSIKDYYPLILIISYITGVPLLIALQNVFTAGVFPLKEFLQMFMAGFFLVFSAMKLLDLKGFKDGYSMYDIVAKKIPAYGYVYPFLELFLGIGYILHLGRGLDIATIILMGVSSIGVLKEVLAKRKMQCACLGTLIKVPLTNVTLVEDLGMLAMAGIMLMLG